jgi:hypothetical protein
LGKSVTDETIYASGALKHFVFLLISFFFWSQIRVILDTIDFVLADRKDGINFGIKQASSILYVLSDFFFLFSNPRHTCRDDVYMDYPYCEKVNLPMEILLHDMPKNQFFLLVTNTSNFGHNRFRIS